MKLAQELMKERTEERTSCRHSVVAWHKSSYGPAPPDGREPGRLDVRTVHRAEARLARARTTQAWPAGLYKDLMGSRLPRPRPVADGNRTKAVDIQ